MKAKYIGLAFMVRKALWLCSLLFELGFPCQSSMLLYSDNQAALTLTRDPRYYVKAKQIHVSFHLTWDLIANGSITTLFICSADNITDIFTKALSRPTHERLRKQLGLAPVVEGEC